MAATNFSDEKVFGAKTRFFVTVVMSQILGLTIATAAEKLTITGASTIAPLALEIAKRFEKKNPGVRVDVQTGGSSRGIVDVRQGLSDIGMVSRALKIDEKDLKSFEVARDGICLILHKSNPVKKLSDEQVVAIYTGKIKNWQDVGGKDVAITVVNKAEGRSTLELFLHYFKMKNSDVKASVVIGDNEQGVKTVAGLPDSIGYVSIGTAEYNVQNGAALKILPIANIEASVASVKSGKFPLSRPLNLVTKAEPDGLQKKFIDFARSIEVKDLVSSQYFVPIAQ